MNVVRMGQGRAIAYHFITFVSSVSSSAPPVSSEPIRSNGLSVLDEWCWHKGDVSRNIVFGGNMCRMPSSRRLDSVVSYG